MPRIFINYRREDSKSEARLLYHSLVAKFARENVIMDIDAIPPASDFRDFLSTAVAECDIFLALVGPRWAEGDSLADPRNWVRFEIEAALKQGKKIVPIMINEAKIPLPESLPESLQPFAYRNGLPLDSGRDYDLHVERIASWIVRINSEDRIRSVAEQRTQSNAADQPLTQEDVIGSLEKMPGMTPVNVGDEAENTIVQFDSTRSLVSVPIRAFIGAFLGGLCGLVSACLTSDIYNQLPFALILGTIAFGSAGALAPSTILSIPTSAAGWAIGGLVWFSLDSNLEWRLPRALLIAGSPGILIGALISRIIYVVRSKRSAPPKTTAP